MTSRAWMLGLAISAGLCSVSFGQITGTVKYDGEVPEPAEIDTAGDPKCAEAHPDGIVEETLVVGEDGELANVVVSIKPAEGKELTGPERTEPVKLDQVGCRYVPHVVAMQIGQPLVALNSDPFLHNVHTQPFEDGNEPENIAMPNKNEKGIKLKPVKTAERFSVKCDVHPWMLAHISAFSHPFFAVSKEDGTFEIPTKGLEDGTYTLLIWQETLGETEQEIEVKDGKATADITLKAQEAAADPVAGPEAGVRLASAEGKAQAKACKGECCEEAKTKAALVKGDKQQQPVGPQAKAN